MDRVRPFLVLLAALTAWLGAPAAAHAAAPVNTTPLSPIGWQSAPYEVDVDGTDADGGLLTAQWRINGIQFAGPAPAAATVSDEGANTFETRIVDPDTNDSGWRTETVRIDTILPADVTDPGPTAWYGSVTSVTLSGFDATSAIDHMDWEVDGGPVQSGPDGTVVGINGDGVHTLRTRAIDLAGNTSAWRTHTIRVDTVDPTDTTAAPGGWQTAPYALAVAGADAHSGIRDVTWRYQGGASTTEPAPATVTVSADGVHVLETQVTDVAGRSSGWKSHTIRIDKSAPDNLTPLAPTSWQAGSYAVVLSGADSVSGVREVQWRVDGQAVTSGASGLQATVTGSGDHLLETRVVDMAGNASGWRAEQVRIDTLPPANTTATPTSPEDNPYTVSVTGTDAHSSIAAVEWRVDGGSLQTGAAGAAATVTGNGAHTLETRVLDAAGNSSGWRTDSFTIDAVTGDATPPVDTTTTVSSAWRVSPVAITVSATDSGSGVERVEWRLDGQPVQSGPTGSFTISADGVHDLETRAFDVAGNGSAWRSQTIRIDRTVPTDTTDLPSGWYGSRTFTLDATDAHSGVADIQYTIDGGPVQHGHPDDVVDLGADGTFEIRRRVLDVAGQASPWTTDTLKVDTVVPVDTTTLPGSSWSTTALSVPLSGTDNASGVTMEWQIDGGATHTGSPAVIDSDGEQLLEVRAIDGAGNASAWQSATVRVDTTAPLNDTPAVSSAWRATPLDVELAGSDAGGSGVDRIEHTLDGGATSTVTTVSVAGDGVHTLVSRAVDVAGHASSWRTDTIRIDSVAPAAAVACTAAGLQYGCRADASDDASGLAAVAYSVDGGAWSGVAAGGSFAVAHGSVRLRAADAAGNETVTTPVALATITPPSTPVDTPPSAPVDTPAPGTVTVRAKTVPIHLAGHSDVASLVGALHAGRAQNGTVSVDLRPLAVGRGKFRVDLRVKAGSRSRRVARTYEVGKLGTLPRIQAALRGASARTTVTLTVKRRAGRKWRAHASAKVVLAS